MPIHCPNCEGVRHDAKCGPVAQCKLARELGGYAIYVPISRCQSCIGSDDGASHASKVVLNCLRLRIGRDWHKPLSEGCACGGPGITLDEAIRRLKERNSDLAQAALTEAVGRGGMPESLGLALAHQFFPEA